MGEPIKAVASVVSTVLPPLEPLIVMPSRVSLDSYLDKTEPPVKRFLKFPVSWVSQTRLEFYYPGVLFRGANIYVEESAVIAPGVIIDTLNKKSRIEIRGNTAIASGVILKGDLRIVNSRIRSGGVVEGKIHLEEAVLGRNVKIQGDDIVVFQSTLLGNISGDTISVSKATLTSKASLLGTHLVVGEDEVINDFVIGKK